MSDILAVFTQNILPILIVATFGFALQRTYQIDKRALSSIVFNCLGPCLVFTSLVKSQLPGDELLQLMAFAIVSLLGMGVLGWLLARGLRFSRMETAAFLVVVIFVNGGNFGLTLNQLRYGDAGLARAIVFYMVNTFLAYTLGVFIASSGELSARQALARLGKLPAVYAAVLAIIVYSFAIPIPAPLLRGLEIAGSGAIPVMLVILGMQIADLRGGLSWRLALPAVSVRLLLGPVMGLLVATVLGLQGLSRSTSIIEASMPTAVFTIILATEFGLQPAIVTGIVVVSTLLSPLTIATTITLLGL
ncbi:MAG: AEC family transporter [Ardenticatenaceae bacterium]|nr:AEC family transporter [Ardenticatenaceae bacterium]